MFDLDSFTKHERCWQQFVTGSNENLIAEIARRVQEKNIAE